MALNIKYYNKKSFVECKLEIKEEDLQEIIVDYLRRHTVFDFDDVDMINNRHMTIWLYALCRRYIDPDHPEHAEALQDAEIEVKEDYDGNSLI